jgi:dephospho-CoA kinase
MLSTSLKKIKPPLKIGITGNMGSGKTLVCSIFKILGIPVFEADLVAKDLYTNNDPLKREMIRLFGKDVYSENGLINRLKISMIFKDPILLQQVNLLVHPLVHSAFDYWSMTIKNGYVLYEAAILIESDYFRKLDALILVTSPEGLRIKRALQQGNLNREQITERMSNQWKEEAKLKYADYIIRNDETELVIPQILEIDKSIRKLERNRTFQKLRNS